MESEDSEPTVQPDEQAKSPAEDLDIEKLEAAIDDYLECQSDRYRIPTLQAYEVRLSVFLDWCREAADDQ